ncbi:hypothetical protein [Modestobacter sp. KNN46-3]|nr:hypothetical protein [Modestobacter sp. KNN46-3]
MIIAATLTGLYQSVVLPQIQAAGFTATTGLQHGPDCLGSQEMNPVGC